MILGRLKDAPNQSTLKEKQWREYLGVVFVSKLYYKENIFCAEKKKSKLKNVLNEKAEIIRNQFRYASNFFYNAVICSLIMYYVWFCLLG